MHKMKEISSHIFVECPNCQETGIVQEIGDINIDCEFFDIPTKKVSYSCYSCNHSKNNFKNDVYQDVWTKGYDYDLLEHKCSACGANDSIRLTKNSKIENHKTSLVCSGCKQERKYRVLALSNWSAQTFPIAEKKFEFLKWFEGIVVSGKEKCIKPDPKIYNIITERYNLKAEECLFIDDNKHNVAAAINLGMESLLFTSPETLKIQLNEKGIKFGQ